MTHPAGPVEPPVPRPRQGLLVGVVVVGAVLLAVVLWLAVREDRSGGEPTTTTAPTGSARPSDGSTDGGAAQPPAGGVVEVTEAGLLDVPELQAHWPGEWTLVRTSPAAEAEEPPLLCASTNVPGVPAAALSRSAIHGPLESDGDGFVEVLAGYAGEGEARGALAEARGWYADGCARTQQELAVDVEEVDDLPDGFVVRLRLELVDEPPFWAVVGVAREGSALVAVAYVQYVGAASGSPPDEALLIAALDTARTKAVSPAG